MEAVHTTRVRTGVGRESQAVEPGAAAVEENVTSRRGWFHLVAACGPSIVDEEISS